MKISVCLATFNGSKFIFFQLMSILTQLKEFDEVIIVDDSSTDDTVSIITNIKDNRIKLFQNEKNIGAALTFSLALSYATGELIFMSDQDDRWHEEKVNILCGLFKAKSLDLIVHDANVEVDGIFAQDSLFSINSSSPGILKNIFKNTYTGCCMAFRSSILIKVLPISPNIGIYHDAWIGILAEYFGYKILFLKTPLIDFVRHDNNASSSKRRNLYLIIRDRVRFIFALLKHLITIKILKVGY